MSTFQYENFALQTSYWGFNSNTQSPITIAKDTLEERNKPLNN